MKAPTTPQSSPLASILYALFCMLGLAAMTGILFLISLTIKKENAALNDHNGGIARIEATTTK